MDLGQSTVLGLAIVADAAGVDEAEFHKVSAVCARAHACVSVSVPTVPGVLLHSLRPIAAAGRGGGKGRQAGECRGRSSDGGAGEQEEQGTPWTALAAA